jgi:hypothetical protein
MSHQMKKQVAINGATHARTRRFKDEGVLCIEQF